MKGAGAHTKKGAGGAGGDKFMGGAKFKRGVPTSAGNAKTPIPPVYTTQYIGGT